MHADEVLRRGANAGLFPQFTFGGPQQRFIGLEMARRLVPQRLPLMVSSTMRNLSRREPRRQR